MLNLGGWGGEVPLRPPQQVWLPQGLSPPRVTPDHIPRGRIWEARILESWLGEREDGAWRLQRLPNSLAPTEAGNWAGPGWSASAPFTPGPALGPALPYPAPPLAASGGAAAVIFRIYKEVEVAAAAERLPGLAVGPRVPPPRPTLPASLSSLLPRSGPVALPPPPGLLPTSSRAAVPRAAPRAALPPASCGPRRDGAAPAGARARSASQSGLPGPWSRASPPPPGPPDGSSRPRGVPGARGRFLAGHHPHPDHAQPRRARQVGRPTDAGCGVRGRHQGVGPRPPVEPRVGAGSEKRSGEVSWGVTGSGIWD